MPLRRLPRGVPALVLLLSHLCRAQSASGSPAPLAPQPPTPKPPVIHVQSDLVLVDVVVTKSGEPVKGLTKDRFRLLENGKEQELKVFDEHSEEEQSVVSANVSSARVPDLAPNNYSDFTQYPSSSTVNVLLLDALNTPVTDQAIVRKEMMEYLKKIPPGTQLAVFTLDSQLHMVQGFTADPSRLAKVISDKNDINRPALADWTLDNRERITLAALKQIAHYLSAIPGRKSLIWFSESFPLAIMRGYYEDVRETSKSLTAARIAVYPVDARGLFPPENVNGVSFDATIRLPAGGGVAAVLDAQVIRDRQQATSESIYLADQTIQQIAGETGGKAFVNSNGFQDAIKQALADGANYYTIGYTPQGKDDGQFRRIKVSVNGGYQLSYRDGYYANSAGRGADTGASIMKEAVQFGAPPPSDIPFKVRVIPSGDPAASGFTPKAGPAGDKAKELKPPLTRYLVDYMVDAHHFVFQKTPDGLEHARLEFAVLAYDDKGQVINLTRQAFGLDLSPATYAQILSSGFPRHQEIDLPAGQIFLRIVVHDLDSSRAGATEVPLTVAKQ